MTYQQRISIITNGNGDMHDLTDQVAAVVAASQVRTGTAHVFNVGSTASIGSIEFEPGLEKDLPAILGKLIPPSRSYGHEQAWHDGNGHSHLQATLLGFSITVPVADGKVVLGTWQQIFHLECGVRGRNREIILTVVGDWTIARIINRAYIPRHKQNFLQKMTSCRQNSDKRSASLA